jgi:hypothetical protein
MQGSLSEFRLAEILQLVAVQQKTGLLRLVRGKQLVTFYFEHGALVATRDRRHAGQDPLLDYLVRVGFLQPPMATYLRAKLEASKEDLGDILVGERFLSEEELRGALDDLAQELVHLTFTWREGTYQFVGGEEALTGIRWRTNLKIDAVLMEGARRADEWPRLLEKLPGPDVVIDLARAPSTTLGPRAYRTLSQIDGVLRLGEVVKRARIPEFEVYEIVAQSAEAGVVRILERPAPVAKPVGPAAAPQPAGSERRRAAARWWTLPRPLGWTLALLLALLSALCAWVVAPRLVQRTAASAVADLEAEQAREKLRRSIETYHALHGSYPASLADLAADRLGGEALLERARPVRYQPEPGGGRYVLAIPAGSPAP